MATRRPRTTGRTVTGTWVYPDGSPAAGEVIFTPARRITDRAADGWVYAPADFDQDFAQAPTSGVGPYPILATSPIGVELDAAGQISIDLVILPDPLVWLVTEKIRGGRHATWALTLTADSDPLNLGDITPVLLPYPPTYPYTQGV